MKHVLIVMSCLLSICITGAAFAGDGSWKRVQDAGELVIGLDDAFPPMGYRVADGTPGRF